MYTQKLRRPLSEDEAQWLNNHPEYQCDLTSPLVMYGANKVYDLRKCSCEKPELFYDNIIVIFEGNLIEIWGAGSIQALSELVKGINQSEECE